MSTALEPRHILETAEKLQKRTVLWLLLLAAPAPAAPVGVSSAAVAAAIRTIEGFDVPLEIRKLAPAPERDLGRDLFFDRRLSRDGKLSCSTCHLPERAFTDGRARAVGHGGRTLRRNTPSLFNITISDAYVRGLFLDGRARTVEEAALIVIQEPSEFDNDPANLTATLGADAGYARRFESLYGPGGLTAENVAKSLAAYVNSLEPKQPSPYDRVLADESALSPAQKRGLLLFVGKADCIACHWNPDLTSGEFLNSGLKPLRGLEDDGRYAVTHNERDRRAFKVPSLRNVGATAPYMHDGSLATLADVVEFYDRGGDRQPGQDERIRALHLTAGEKKDLEAFLNSLTYDSPSRAVSAPAGPAAAAGPRYWDLATDIRRELETSERLLGELEALRAPWTKRPAYAGPECAKSFTPETLLADAEAGVFDEPETVYLQNYAFRDLIDYVKYRAFLDKNPRECDRLDYRAKIFQSPYAGTYHCRNWYNETGFLRALLGPPKDFPKSCRSALARGESELPAVGAVCDAAASSLGNPAAMCEKLLPRFLPINWLRSCRNLYEPLRGEPVSCEPFERNSTGLERCLMINAFARASRAHDPSLCAGSESCEVLMGGGRAVQARVAARLKAKVCRGTPAAPGKTTEVTALLDLAEAQLAEAGAGAPAEAREQRNALSRLRDRLKKL